MLWSVAFPFTALVFSLFLVFLNYGTKAITTYALTTYVFDRFMPGARRFRWLLLILGLVIYVFLQAITILGWVIGVVVTAWGIGAAWLAWRNRRTVAPAIVPVAGTELPDSVANGVASIEDDRLD